MKDWPPHIIPQGEPFIIPLPKDYALAPGGYYYVGCMECDYVMRVDHDCWDLECDMRHPEVDQPIPMRILPHWAHPRYAND